MYTDDMISFCDVIRKKILKLYVILKSNPNFQSHTKLKVVLQTISDQTASSRVSTVSQFNSYSFTQ